MKAVLYTFTIALLTCSLSLPAQGKNPGLKIFPLTGDTYVYTTYHTYNGQLVPSNSMYVVTSKGVVMLDTPWDTTQLRPLLDTIEKRHGKKVVLSISTHYHADRTAGLDYLKQKGISTYSSKQTYDLCQQHNEEQPAYYFVNDTTFTIGNYSFLAYYAGEGHTKDNIVVWIDSQKILYGGCLVKSTESKDLGNIADANLANWPATIKNLMKKFPRRTYVIPGHFGWVNNKSLEHTLDLLEGATESH